MKKVKKFKKPRNANQGRIAIPNGCWYTDINCYPSNWDTSRAPLNVDWLIEYRFFDPVYKEQYPDGYPKRLKGINRIKDRVLRQEAMREMKEQEEALLKEGGYNPIVNSLLKKQEKLFKKEPNSVQTDRLASKQTLIIQPNTRLPYDDGSLSTKNYILTIPDEITPTNSTLFIDGLWLGIKLIYKKKLFGLSEQLKAGFKVQERNIMNFINDLGGIVRKIDESSKILKMNGLPIGEIGEQHLIPILSKCRDLNIKLSAERYNRYLSYLGSIFNELKLFKAVANNPCAKIPRMDILVELKDQEEIEDVFSKSEREDIKKLKDKHPNFYRFIQIFYHSGARETELMRVDLSQVNLESRRPYVKVLVQKRETPTIVRKPIKEIAIPYWQEILKEAEVFMNKVGCERKDVVLFSRNLKPGLQTIREDNISKRWKKYVQKEFGIGKTFYDLKAANTTSQMDLLIEAGIDIEEAEKRVAKFNDHTSTTMVKKRYDRKNKDRRDLRVVNIMNEF